MRDRGEQDGAGDLRHRNRNQAKEGDPGRADTRPRSCPACRLRTGTRGSRDVVPSRVGVKSWVEKQPSTDEVRPARCPVCSAASRPTGGCLVLHGHGLRERQLRGPMAIGESPRTVLLFVRRFECQRCGAVTTVGPSEMVTRRLFSSSAVALALALFGVLGLCATAVRKQVSPWSTVGATSATGWCTLLRWARAVRDGKLFLSVRRAPADWCLRQVAERAATTLAAQAPLGQGPPDLAARAFIGASLAA